VQVDPYERPLGSERHHTCGVNRSSRIALPLVGQQFFGILAIVGMFYAFHLGSSQRLPSCRNILRRSGLRLSGATAEIAWRMFGILHVGIYYNSGY
jgi:hypothetical protein